MAKSKKKKIRAYRAVCQEAANKLRKSQDALCGLLKEKELV